jgi:hypothetical protein
VLPEGEGSHDGLSTRALPEWIFVPVDTEVATSRFAFSDAGNVDDEAVQEWEGSLKKAEVKPFHERSH